MKKRTINFKTFALQIALVLSFFSYSSSVASAQTDSLPWKANRESHFNQPHLLFPDGLTLFLLRQDLSLVTNTSRLKFETPTGNNGGYRNSNFILESYIPLFSASKFSSMFGMRYSKASILSKDDDYNKEIQHLYSYAVCSYDVNKWRLMLSIEYYLNGDMNSYSEQKGNEIMPLITVGYEFNRKWKLIMMTGINRNYMVGEISDMIIPGLMATYKPSENFQMAFGSPIPMAIDWRVSKRIDVGGKVFLTSSISSEAYATYHFKKDMYISLHYDGLDHRGGRAFFNEENYNDDISYNNMKQFQQNYSINYGCKISKTVGMILSAGYNMGGDISLYNNDDHLRNISGAGKYFIGVAFQLINMP